MKIKINLKKRTKNLNEKKKKLIERQKKNKKDIPV